MSACARVFLACVVRSQLTLRSLDLTGVAVLVLPVLLVMELPRLDHLRLGPQLTASTLALSLQPSTDRLHPRLEPAAVD